MFNQQSNVAILIFANSSKKEAEQKFLGKGERLFTYLNKKTVLEATKTKAQVIIYNEKHQRGANFNERFTNALEHTFSKGFQHVIAIGNDSPNLRASHIQKAITSVQNNQCVLGPSIDGGVYLIALSKKQFNKDTFLHLPWQTTNLFSCLKETLEKENHHVCQLTYLKDIDSEKDLTYFLNRFKTTAFLKKLIIEIVALFNISYNKITSVYLYQYTSFLYNKGSPL